MGRPRSSASRSPRSASRWGRGRSHFAQVVENAAEDAVGAMGLGELSAWQVGMEGTVVAADSGVAYACNGGCCSNGGSGSRGAERWRQLQRCGQAVGAVAAVGVAESAVGVGKASSVCRAVGGAATAAEGYTVAGTERGEGGASRRAD